MTTTPPVKGYTPLSPTQVQAGNTNKLIEELVLRQIDRLMNEPATDKRFLAIAKTHIQEGFMSLNRAVFLPQRIETEIDVAALFEGLDMAIQTETDTFFNWVTGTKMKVTHK